jgi:hypothetical protein
MCVIFVCDVLASIITFSENVDEYCLQSSECSVNSFVFKNNVKLQVE